MAATVALLVLYAGALVWLRPPSPGVELSLDAVQAQALAGEVAQAELLDQDARIVGTLAGDEAFWVAYPSSDAATSELLANLVAGGAQVSVDAQTAKATVRFVAQFLLPLMILASLFGLLFYLARGSGGSGTEDFLLFGRLGDKRTRDGDRPKTTFADVAAAQTEIAELAEVRDYLDDPTRYKAMGALPPKGVLLVGPPGCGKTLLARAVAGEADAAFFSLSGSEFVESLVGVGAARVRDLFAQARAAAPAIIFIDELDGAGRQRGAGLGGGHDEREQTLNELLVQMDGFSPTEGLVVMGATNRPDILDPALLRAGRFDRRIGVELPDAEGREAILVLHAKTRRLGDPRNDLAVVARRTAGFTGADLANVVNEAALLAVRWGHHEITRTHLEEAVERVISGPKRKTRLLDAGDKHRVAVHEAGHVLVAAAVGKAAKLEKVSIVARGQGVGHLAVLADDTAVPTRSDMAARITIAMAGVAAEELILGEPSVGSEADLERATDTARDMAGRYGMSPRIGRVRILQAHGEVFLGRDYLANGEVSQPTLEALDTEVRQILDDQEATAHAILAAHPDTLDTLVAALLEHETLQGDQLSRLLADVEHHDPSGNGKAAAGAKATPKRRT
ncbi:MAG: ATP-dependent zinc metalloprotease FtsH [Egibacteraceae bacterium]